MLSFSRTPRVGQSTCVSTDLEKDFRHPLKNYTYAPILLSASTYNANVERQHQHVYPRKGK